MDSKKVLYEIEFTEDCRDEIREIYKYISENLVEKESAKKLMQKMKKSVMGLVEYPRLYSKIEKKNKRKRNFRKIVVDNYVILYTIDDNKKTIYISHMYYSGKNYLETENYYK